MAFKSQEDEIAWLKAKLKEQGVSKKKVKKAKKVGPDGKPVKRSGCKLEKEFKYHDGTIGPMLWGWRLSKKLGYQTFTAYLSKDGGKPQNPKTSESGEKCLVFVVNLKTEGLGKQPAQSGVWSLLHKKLTISDASLVANPNADRGGYFGRGGERYKDKVNK